MLLNIINGTEKPKVVILKDTVEQSGRELWKSYTTSLCDRVERVHIFSFDHSPDDVLQDLPKELHHKISVHDFFHDFRGWLKTDKPNVDTDLLQYVETCLSSHDNQTVALMFTSLSCLMLHRSASYTCQIIHKLKARNKTDCELQQIFCLLHGDLHDIKSVTLVEHEADCVLSISPSRLQKYSGCCAILYKKVSGKVIRKLENFCVEGYRITATEDVQDKASMLQSDVSQEQSDPTANLTFNLTLTDKEKAARSQLKLPYIIDKERQAATLNPVSGSGQIFYEPDAADDFDEEDPDDDLDI